jgi:predicted transcriptional regulator
MREDSESQTKTEHYSTSLSRVHEKMDYNQLKMRVLELFKGPAELASEDLRRMLHDTQVEVSDKAMKMALMRYTRQGLLARSKKKGHYCYSLTEKGSARRDWLSNTR